MFAAIIFVFRDRDAAEAFFPGHKMFARPLRRFFASIGFYSLRRWLRIGHGQQKVIRWPQTNQHNVCSLHVFDSSRLSQNRREMSNRESQTKKLRKHSDDGKLLREIWLLKCSINSRPIRNSFELEFAFVSGNGVQASLAPNARSFGEPEFIERKQFPETSLPDSLCVVNWKMINKLG